MKKTFVFASAILFILISCKNNSSTTSNSYYVRTNDKSGSYDMSLSNVNPFDEDSNELKGFNLDNVNGYFAKINRGGYITNKIDLNDIDSFTIKYKVVDDNNIDTKPETGFGPLYYVTDDYYIDNPFSYEANPILKSNDEITVDLPDNPAYISFYSANTILIEKIVLNYNYDTLKEYTDSFTLKVIGTNDIHGRVNSDGTYQSLAYATSYIDDLKHKNKYNLILDQGDLYQGSLDQYATNGKIMEDYLLINGYDSTILGNHEWDNGEKKIEEHVNHNVVDLLACNIRKSDGSIPKFSKPYKVIERHGVKIGLIGAIGNCRSSISASMVEGYDFLTGNNLTNEIIKHSKTLKSLGCEFIILQLHDGAEKAMNNANSLEYYDVSKLSGEYIDLVFEGHTHKIYNFKDSKGIYHIQGAGYLGTIYSIDLHITKENNQNKFSYGNVNSIRDKEIITKYNENNLMGEINKWYHDNVYGPIGDEIATTNSPSFDSTALKKLMAKIYFELGKNDGYDIFYGGGFLSVRAPYNLNKGTITYSQLASLFPFDNTLYLCRISGRNLKNNFINSTNSNYFGYTNGNDISSIVDNNMYYIVTDSYNTDFWNYRSDKSVALEIVKNYTEITNKYARDLLFDYLKENY